MVTAETPYIRLTELRGRAVVTEAGTADAEVDDVLFGEDERTATGLALGEGGLLRRPVGEVPMDDVDHLGPDAVVVAQIRPRAEGTGSERKGRSVIEASALSDKGIELGDVADLILRTHRGRTKAVAIEITTGDGPRYLVLDDDVALFGDVVLVPAGDATRLLDSPEAVASSIEA